jgi:hypothetical protein
MPVEPLVKRCPQCIAYPLTKHKGIGYTCPNIHCGWFLVHVRKQSENIDPKNDSAGGAA